MSPNTLLRVLSYIPFTSPIAMPRRIVMGDTAAWEPWVAIALLIVGMAVTIAVSARIYSGALLQTTGKGAAPPGLVAGLSRSRAAPNRPARASPVRGSALAGRRGTR